MYSRPCVILSGAKDLYIMLRIYFYQLNTADLTEHADRYIALLPPWRTERYHRMKLQNGRLEELAAGLLLRHALKDAAGIDLMTAEVTKNEHGKPMLGAGTKTNGAKAYAAMSKTAGNPAPTGGATAGPAVHFNISHSGGYIAVAVSDHPVGIDVETKSDPDLKVTARFYSEAEQAAVRAAEDPQKAFRRLWTRKEAYVKCAGTGIYDSVAEIPSLEDVSGEYRLFTLREEDAYTLSVVVQGEITMDISDIPLDIVTFFDV